MTCKHGHRIHQCGKCLRKEVWPAGFKACRCGLLIDKQWTLCRDCLNWESEDYASDGVAKRRERRKKLQVDLAVKIASEVAEGTDRPVEGPEPDLGDLIDQLVARLGGEGRSEREIADAAIYARRQRMVRRLNQETHEAMKELIHP